ARRPHSSDVHRYPMRASLPASSVIEPLPLPLTGGSPMRSTSPSSPPVHHPSRRLLALVAALALLTPSLLLQALQPPPATADVTDEQLSRGGVLPQTRNYRVAPGLDLTTFSRLEAEGWNEGSALTADLTESSLSMDVADGGSVAGRAPLTDVMTSGPSGEQAVA